MSEVVAGIFIGGSARRMGGVAKGLLRAPGETRTLVEKLVDVCLAARVEPVWVGRDARIVETMPAMRVVDDDPPGVGPLGGLAALIAYASPRKAIALASDMPFVVSRAIERLATAPSDALVLAARAHETAPFEPMFARYDPRVLPIVREAIAEGVRSFQVLFARMPVERFPLADDERELIRDWDSPGDVARQRGAR